MKIWKISENLEDMRKSVRYQKIWKIPENLEDIRKSWRSQIIWKLSENLEDIKKSGRSVKFCKISENLEDIRKSGRLQKIWKRSESLGDIRKSGKYQKDFLTKKMESFLMHSKISILSRNITLLDVYYWISCKSCFFLVFGLIRKFPFNSEKYVWVAWKVKHTCNTDMGDRTSLAPTVIFLN